VPGGLASVPQSSFNYKDVGVNLEMTPRVTYEGEIVLDGFTVESSALGPSISVAGQDVPSFSSRKVSTKLRLREGESTLLAGLLRDEQRKILTGFPGIMRAPILRSLFGQTQDEVNQSDIVMLLTPSTGPPTPTPAAPGVAPPAGAVTPPGVVPPAPPRDPNAPPTAPPGAATPPSATTAQVIVTPPGTEFRVAGGPYTVPVSINNATRISTMTLTITFNPAILRVRTTNEGTFMRQGNVSASYTPKIDNATGRVDIAISRAADQ